MALAETKKINIIAHKQNQKDFLEILQNLGFMELEENTLPELEKENLNEKISALDYQAAGIKFSLDFLSSHETQKKSLAEKIDPAIELTQAQLESTVKNFDIQKKVDEVQEIESSINEATSVIDKLAIEQAQIQPWHKLSFIPNKVNLQTSYNYKFITISDTVYLELVDKIQKTSALTAIEKVNEFKKEVYAVIFFKADQEGSINEIVNDLNAKLTELPDLEKTINERLKEINQIIDQKNSQIEKATKQAQVLANDQRELKITSDYLDWQKNRLENQAKAAHTKQTFSLIGWIDASRIKKLEKEFNKVSTSFAIEELEIGKDENVPVIFKNSWARSFEAVTGVYGAPLHDEPDPTPFLTPFFVLFFALCLTDAGYGIILALVSLAGLKFLKPSDATKKMLKVLLWGGIATFFAGAAVGGWFGIVIDDLAAGTAKNILTGLRAIDPVKDPITMLIFSLILGIIQIMVGLMVGFWWKVKNNNLKDALMDEAMWFYFLIAILLWGSTKAGLTNYSWSTYLVYAGVLGIILTQGRKNKNPFLKLITGVISLYGLVGYLSDVLSYSRLLALGLATGIIAMVINLIAGLAIEMVPYFGWVIAAFIIIGGHIFNLAINALGAFIHSSRLQFVEFFPKFMEGGGSVFQPFAKESKFVRINNKENLAKK